MNARLRSRSKSARPPAEIAGACESAGAGVACESASSDVWTSIHHTAILLSLDDADLVNRAIGTHEVAPDAEAFGVLYERYVHAIFAFGLSRLHNVPQAEDITSQTFLQALQALPRYQQRGVPIRHWLFTIAANVISGVLRAAPGIHVRLGVSGESGQDALAAEAVLDLPDPCAEAEIDAWVGAEEFRRMVQVLSPEQRTVIRLRFADGMPIAAIAVRTGRTAGAVKALQFRGVQELRRRWEREPGMGRTLASSNNLAG